MESKNDMYVPLWFLSAFKVVTCGLTNTIIMQFSLSQRECRLLRLNIIKVFKVKLPYVLFFQGNPACSDLKLLFSSEDR